jgi:hypothetical protein
MTISMLFLVGIVRSFVLFSFVAWIALVIIISNAGRKRKIGFWIALLLSIFLTPLIGFIAVILSDKKDSQVL